MPILSARVPRKFNRQRKVFVHFLANGVRAGYLFF